MTDKLTKTAEKLEESSFALPGEEKIDINQQLTPPCNRDAQKAEDVYNLEHILTDFELQSLQNEAETVSELYDSKEKISEAQKGRKISDLFAMMLDKNLKIPDSRNFAIAMYMEGVVQFLGLRANQFAKGIKALPEMLPMAIRQKIFNTFTDEG